MKEHAKKLKYRHELKYYVNYHDYYILSHRLKRIMKRDKHTNENGEYLISSLYFDDIDNTALSDKLAGINDRVKYRIRTYNRSDEQIILEKKIKNGSHVAKIREKTSIEIYRAIISSNYEVIKNIDMPLHKELYMKMKNNLLRPKVIVEYVREAYVSDPGNIRITFDKELSTGLNQLDLLKSELSTIRSLDEEHTILEVKYDSYLPEHIKDMIQLEGLVKQSASKYVICRKYIKSNLWEDN
ncbi:VTC domain-containig protein [Gottschalkia acidurici 9a]|uniref:VTC domain-containig protein n=1 Tax=Gottschalkia acidurici (strain ATCC 7906 / DSM 604 / BCRC 14475 / CIP 104303 / KCTC 5404 / NCIMB 10678 / 9a) TaxID=1128398 RepID=K0B0D6_GOTA9|nr:polyphosphate polymerase domain-containing protein [Gottschalkia acidurici]AFS79498.1 VTC domain-containig protein [Gottschalkia acidurici 9a]